MTELQHQDPCICTIDIRDGSIVDYDCGFDIINKARHYNSHPSGVEAIDICRHLTGDWFNVFKYVFRADHKNGRQDVEKSLYYAKDGINHGIPIHAPTWTWQTQVKLDRVIKAETQTARINFFTAIKLGDVERAKEYIEEILEQWPSDD